MTKLVRCGINFYADVDNKKAVNDRDALQNTKLMEHYTHLLGQLQYEGAGIWSRFNIMFGINVSLFGLETVLFNSVCQTSEYLTFIIAFGGLSFSIWSIYVMQRLWSYHEHWKNMLCEAEKTFPDEYEKREKILGVMAEIIHSTFFCHIVSYLVAYYSVKPCYLY